MNEEDKKRLRELQVYNRKNDDKRDHKKFKSRHEEIDDSKYEYGKKDDKRDRKKEVVIMDKVDYNRSGLLENSNINGSRNNNSRSDSKEEESTIKLKWAEPSESRVPKEKWLIYPFKESKALDPYPIYKKKSYLFGRDRSIADIPIDHPSCSSQHSVLVFREITDKLTDKKVIKPYLIDLESTNGTFLNQQKMKTARYQELRSKDMIKFGQSTREYVIICEEEEYESSDSDSDSGSDNI